MVKYDDKIFTNVKDFHSFKQNYEIILKRINTFIRNAGTGNIPEKSLSLFILTLFGYKELIQKEQKDIKEKIEKARENELVEETAKLNKILMDINLYYFNILNLYNRYKNVKSLSELQKIEHNFSSLNDIKETEKNIDKFKRLLKDYNSWNNYGGIKVSLDDKIEKDIENKGNEFILFEIDYLTRINEIQKEISDKKEAIFNSSFFKNYNFTFKEEYVISKKDIDKSSFVKDYLLFTEYYEKFLIAFECKSMIDQKIEKFINGGFSELKIIKDFVEEYEKILKKNGEIDIIIDLLNDLYFNKYDINYLDIAFDLILKNPYKEFNDYFINDIYNRKIFNNLSYVIKHYTELKKLTDIKKIDLISCNFSNSFNKILNIFYNKVDKEQQNIIKKTKNIKNNFPLKLNIKFLNLGDEKQDILELRNSISEVLNIYQNLVGRKSNLVSNKISYNGFKETTINEIINEKINNLKINVLLKDTPDMYLEKIETQKDLIYDKLGHFLKYLKFEEEKISDKEEEKIKIIQEVKKIKQSLSNIYDYDYEYGDSLSYLKNKIIFNQSFSTIIYGLLVDKLEEKYDEEYDNYQERRRLRNSSLSMGSSSMSSGSSFSSSGSSWGGGFSSFSGGFSSGGTSF